MIAKYYWWCWCNSIKGKRLRSTAICRWLCSLYTYSSLYWYCSSSELAFISETKSRIKAIAITVSVSHRGKTYFRLGVSLSAKRALCWAAACSCRRWLTVDTQFVFIFTDPGSLLPKETILRFCHGSVVNNVFCAENPAFYSRRLFQFHLTSGSKPTRISDLA